MKVKGLDGREHPWSLGGLAVGKIDSVERSGLHLRVRTLLKSLFPTEPILEEVPLPGSGSLTADFYLPVRRTIVEAHGPQHLQYVAYFHQNRAGWARQRRNDQNKIAWSELNNLRLVALHHNEDLQTWTDKLLRG